MRTGAIKVGDLVKCDVRGRIFYAEVRDPDVVVVPKGVLKVKAITPGITWTHVSPNQIIGHYSKRKGSR